MRLIHLHYRYLVLLPVRILKPWVRDPAFYKSVWTYKSDVPAHEGPTHHATTELWTYEFPLSTEERERLISDLRVIPSLNKQAQQNDDE